MLREFVESKHYKFAREASSWQEAIRMSCESLEEDGVIDKNYAQDIIDCVTKYGPYIVIMPEVAMPHSQEGAAIQKRMQDFFSPWLPVTQSSI